MITSAVPARVRPLEFVLLGAVGAALVMAHWKPLVALVGLWERSPMYSYGYTVPFISAYLLWVRRDALNRVPARPALVPGGVVLLAGVGLLYTGEVAGILLFQQLAFIVSLVGAVLLVLGVEWLRVGWAAFAYLLLMVPVWDGFTEPLHAPFQQWSAQLGVAIVQAIGLPVYREGTIIALPLVTLEVARSCSGVNYLIAVLALGLPLAYLYVHGTWRRLLLVGSAIVVAAVSNGLRVALIAVLTYFDIGSPLHGPFHVLHGLFVAGIGYAVLIAGLRLLATNRPERASAALPAGAHGHFRIAVPYAIALTVLFTLVGWSAQVETSAPVRLSRGLDSVPLQLGGWRGELMGDAIHSGITWWAGADAQLYRRYRRADGVTADAYVAYFESQRQSKEIVNFMSAELHRGASRITIAPADGRRWSANLVKRIDRRDVLVLFWYDIDGIVETGEYPAKLRTLWNAVARRRTNGAVILLRRADGGSRHATAADLQELAAALQPSLAAHLATR